MRWSACSVELLIRTSVTHLPKGFVGVAMTDAIFLLDDFIQWTEKKENTFFVHFFVCAKALL